MRVRVRVRVRVRAGVQVEREHEFLSFAYRGPSAGFIEFIKIKIQSHHMTYNVYVGWFLISCTQ